MSGYRTPLGRVRGLGAAKHGVSGFVAQRVSAAALVLLVLWGVWAALGLAQADYAGAVAWLHAPANAILLSLLIGVGAFHMRIGMADIILDYIERPTTKAALLTLNIFAAWLAGAIGVFSVLKVALSSGTY
ncbi:MAG TPA: succinate dehydrogenase, hydrophobic membrane anchor protein [Caulobacteraceae bacterium]|jgi:succinate dehydrogenase / fumarate reductase membrane anchor subunit|nr:succinate dehydrogenase, hydrophobic membrane anchor protein [Caulobacteraceae bacterium]